MDEPIGTIAAFDFDGTLTDRDTLWPFLLKSFGKRRTLAAGLRLAPEFARLAFRRTDRSAVKEKLIAALFAGQRCARLDAVAQAFADDVEAWLRPAALARLRWHRERGHRCVLVSASLDLYLAPVAARLGIDDLICTRLARRQGVFDGRLIGENCRRQEKVSRLRERYGELERFEIYAYGDSGGDTEMLAIADHAYYRPFEAAAGQLADPARGRC